VKLSIPVTSSFPSGVCYIRHTKSAGLTYVYRGTVSNNILSFEDPHGFSTFELGITEPVAVVDYVTYDSLQAAVNAVKDGGTISLYQTGKHEAVVSNKALKFTITRASTSTTVTIKDAQGNEVSPKTSGLSLSYTITQKALYTITNPDYGTATLEGATLTITPKDGYIIEKITLNGVSVTIPTNGILTGLKDTDQVEITFAAQPKEEVSATSFTDIPSGAYYGNAVAWAVEKGITTGTSKTTFSPGMGCSRGQVVTFLWRAAGSPTPTTTSKFIDVPSNSYYAKAVAWAVENGITNGTGDHTFSPTAVCTRAQVVTFLSRYAGGQPSSIGTPFTDVSTSAYYAKPVAWAVETGITSGTSTTTFSPNAVCTRAQVVTFLYRCLN
jgi:hypothetical protein